MHERASNEFENKKIIQKELPAHALKVMTVTATIIDDCAKDGGKEFFTEMHCVI